MNRRSAGLKDEKRQRLFEAAIAEFNEFGHDNASFNRIIERSGVSKGTVYYYFDNKDALLTLVFEEIGSQLLNAVPDLPLPDSPEDFWSTLWSYRQKEFDFFTDNPTLGQILLIPRSVKIMGLFNKAHDGSMARVIERHIALLERGQELGAVRSDIKARTILDIIGAAGEVACRFTFDDNPDAFMALLDSDKRERLKKYDAISRDMIYRALLPPERLRGCIHNQNESSDEAVFMEHPKPCRRNCQNANEYTL